MKKPEAHELAIMPHLRVRERLIDILKPVMQAVRFSRKEATWYRHDSEVTQFIDFQVSEKKVAVRLCAVLRKFSKETHPTIYDEDITLGLGWLFEEREDWSEIRCHTQWNADDDERLALIVTAVVKRAIPVLDSWRSEAAIREFLRTTVASNCQVRERVRQ